MVSSASAPLQKFRWGDYTLVRPDPQIIWPRHGTNGTAAPWENWDGFYHRSE